MLIMLFAKKINLPYNHFTLHLVTTGPEIKKTGKKIHVWKCLNESVIKWKHALNILRYIWFFIMATYKNLNNKMYRNISDLDFVIGTSML